MRTILQAAVAAADPAPHVRDALSAHNVLRSSPVRLVALGKAAVTMASAALESLPAPPVDALVITPHGTPGTVSGARVLTASHPLPDDSSMHAGREVMRFLDRATSGDIVLALVSGGASSLCVAPLHDVTIAEYADVVRQLMHAGADIHELNCVRAHIDALKGGGMAVLATPAESIALVVSDVVGNALHTIASGPFNPHPSTPADALEVLTHYDIPVPEAIRASLDAYRHTPEVHSDVRIILDNADAVAGAARAAAALGYDVLIDDEPVTGHARDAGVRLAVRALDVAREMTTTDAAICLLYGGETTVRVTGTGKGGRNQELALATALALDGDQRITLGSIGTDGIDGTTDAAGAVVDGTTVKAASAAGLDVPAALAENDSHPLLDRVGSLIRLEPTGTNVMDVQAVVIDPPW